MANPLKEAIFKEAYRCERIAYEAQCEHQDCFDKWKIKCIVDDEVSKNGLSNEYEEFKRNLK